MTFPHQDPDFDALLEAAAQVAGLSSSLVEKDYWVTHTLWVLGASGLDIWFKGGTSLSKGYGLIQRFSEDLDLKIGPGARTDLPAVSSWRTNTAKAKATREAYWRGLVQVLRSLGLDAALDPETGDPRWLGANIRVSYPGTRIDGLPGDMNPFVLLEVGEARVTPFVPRDMSSFVHEGLAALNLLGDYRDNRPRGVRSVHPLVTLLEKLDAIRKRLEQDQAAAKFVRHYEDAVQIIRAQGSLPPLAEYANVAELAEEMATEGQLTRGIPRSDSLAFQPDEGARWQEIRQAHSRIAPMFWGPRIALDDACAAIRGWIDAHLS